MNISLTQLFSFVLFLLLSLSGCSAHTEPNPSQSDSGRLGTLDDAGLDAEQDVRRSCRGWEEEAGPVPDDFEFTFGDDELGHYLQLAMLVRWHSGPNAHWVFVCALQRIREVPRESADRLFQAYSRHPHELRQDRWDLANQLSILATKWGVQHLTTIALEPIEVTYDEHGDSVVSAERGIRITAINGLETLIFEGIATQAAQDGLIRVVLEHEDDGLKERAAGILKSSGMSRADFRRIVEGTDSEWLLDSY